MKELKVIISALICFALLFGIFSALTGNVSVVGAEQEPFSLNAIDFLKNINAGWNLGNTMEATDSRIGNWVSNPTPNEAESGWWNPVTTQEMIDEVAKAGFNAIRLPVSWVLFTDKVSDGEYVVDQLWIDRVKEIVQYCYNNDLYVIVNMHHDDKTWLDITKTGAEWEEIKEKYRDIWTHIADAFKDYDEKLILEAANEIVAGGDWWGQQQIYFDKINEVYQIFYSVVRNSGGNNDKRYLMLPTYGAQWYSHQYNNVWTPEDDDHVIIDIHWYSNNAKDFETYFSAMYEDLISKGKAVVIGECGIRRDASEATKLAWANAYYGTAAKYGLRCFIWDDGGNFQVLNRKTLSWVSNGLNQAILNAVENGSPQSTSEPTTPGPTNPPTVFIHNAQDYNITSTIAAAEYAISYSNGWEDANTYAERADNGGVYAYAIWDDRAVNQLQINREVKNINNMVNAAKELGNAKIAFDFEATFTIDDDEIDPQGYFRISFPSLEFTGGDFDFIVKSGTKTTILIDLEYFTQNVSEIQIQLNNYKNFGNAFYNPSFTLSLPYIAVVGENVEVIYGDANSDGKVSSKDSLVIKQFHANWDVEIDKVAADVNLDGNVNTKDSLLLRKFIAGWDVELGKAEQ